MSIETMDCRPFDDKAEAGRPSIGWQLPDVHLPLTSISCWPLYIKQSPYKAVTCFVPASHSISRNQRDTGLLQVANWRNFDSASLQAAIVDDAGIFWSDLEFADQTRHRGSIQSIFRV